MSLPLVSVVLPYFNHRPFLPRRLKSISEQTYPHLEFIVLDDASTDGGADLLMEFCNQHPNAKYLPNTVNTGSPFTQWNRGMDHAKGKYVWMAESDDFADPKLIETLVGIMEENPTVGLAFTQSMVVNERDEVLHSFNEHYRFLYSTDRWERDFIASGSDECVRYLLTNNTIPNASSVLFRRTDYMKIGGAPANFKLNGDWFLYAKILTQSDLAFVAQPLNYFRQHQNTQRHKARRDATAYFEMLDIQNYIKEKCVVDDEAWNKARKQVAEWWIGSIPHQRWRTKGFTSDNLQLYKTFSPLYTALWLRISWHMIYAVGWYFLFITGLLNIAKATRNALFPGKYFNPQP